jgi:acetate kinase
MNVLAINCGSSSLKFRLAAVHAAGDETQPLASGSVSGIGGSASLAFHSQGGAELRAEREIRDEVGAVRAALDWLGQIDSGGSLRIDATGHRIVHGGVEFHGPTLVDAASLERIERLSELAPLHNGPAVAALRATRTALGTDVPAVAVFDTSFHQTMPPRAALYALPLDLMERHGIRRFGFHGLAHRWMVERFSAITGRSAEATRLITVQLGSGCSIAAVEGGRSIDTTMGFTPLEGLMMGTRSGDIDPSLPAFLVQSEHTDAAAIERLLNSRSGLVGVSGQTADMRRLLQSEAEGDERAALAIEMFAYRVRKGIGAYLAALRGAEAIIFGGGIGEHAPEVRRRICAGLEWCGLRLDEARNDATLGSEARISADGATPAAFVIAVDEESLIVRDTAASLTAGWQPAGGDDGV